MSEHPQPPQTDDQHRQSGDAGLPDPDDVAPEELEELEAERQQRLSADNRPENVEVDNTERTFDPDAGRFTDDPDYDPEDTPFAGGDNEA